MSSDGEPSPGVSASDAAGSGSATSDDHRLAHTIAAEVADRLYALQEEMIDAGANNYDIEHVGDRVAHDWIVEQLTAARPLDALLSEEGHDDRTRVSSSRTWIIDPLDGSSGFGYGGPEWAVHVALAIDGQPVVGAVGSPGVGVVASTYDTPTGDVRVRDRPIVVTGRTRSYSEGALLGRALGAEVVACSSAGVKAALVATGRADVYVHDSPLYEWDVCAPAAMAITAGLDVSDPFGEPLEFNRSRPVVEGIVVCRPEFTETVLHALADRRVF